MQTPWGSSQQIEKILPGVSWVSTASHGGLMVATGAAEKYLTPKAIELGKRYGSYICFEEDCAYAIAFFQNPAWKRFLDQHSLAEWNCSVFEPDSYMGKAKASAVPKLQTELAKSDDAIRDDMRAIVESWFPEFFGITVEEMSQQMRANAELAIRTNTERRLKSEMDDNTEVQS